MLLLRLFFCRHGTAGIYPLKPKKSQEKLIIVFLFFSRASLSEIFSYCCWPSMGNMIERMPFSTKHYFVDLVISAQLLRRSRRRWTLSRTKVIFRLIFFAPNNCFLYRTAELRHTKHLLMHRQVHLKLKKVSKKLVSQFLDSPMAPFSGKF